MLTVTQLYRTIIYKRAESFGKVLHVKLPSLQPIRILTLQILGDNKYIVLSEVEIYGHKLKGTYSSCSCILWGGQNHSVNDGVIINLVAVSSLLATGGVVLWFYPSTSLKVEYFAVVEGSQNHK